MIQKLFIQTLSVFTLVLVLTPVALANSFTDVPKEHYAYSAIEYLKDKGYVQGYDDGTFKPK